MRAVCALLMPAAWAAAPPCARVGVAYEATAVPNAGFYSDSGACAKSCEISPSCQGFTWKENSEPKGGCWHFSTVPKEILESGAVSGPKSCQDVAAEVGAAAATAADAKLTSISDAVSSGVNGAAVENLKKSGADDMAAAAGSKWVVTDANTAGKHVTNAVNGVTDAANGVTDGVANAANGVTNGVTNAANGVTNGVNGAANGVANGMTDAANGVANHVAGVTNGVTDAANGVTNGVTDAANGVANHVAGVTNGATDAANGVADSASSAANDAANGVNNAFNSLANHVTGAANDVTNGVTGAVADAKASAAALFATTPEPSLLDVKGRLDQNPWFIASLVITVCTACSLRYVAHLFFNDRSQAKREEHVMRRKARAVTSASEDIDLEKPAATSPSVGMSGLSLSGRMVQPGPVTYSGTQPMMMSQAMPQPMTSYQSVGSPVAYGPVTVAPQPTYIVG